MLLLEDSSLGGAATLRLPPSSLMRVCVRQRNFAEVFRTSDPCSCVRGKRGRACYSYYNLFWSRARTSCPTTTHASRLRSVAQKYKGTCPCVCRAASLVSGQRPLAAQSDEPARHEPGWMGRRPFFPGPVKKWDSFPNRYGGTVGPSAWLVSAFLRHPAACRPRAALPRLSGASSEEVSNHSGTVSGQLKRALVIADVAAARWMEGSGH